jgi:hypothetical protein
MAFTIAICSAETVWLGTDYGNWKLPANSME